jgi:hypothetical protein
MDRHARYFDDEGRLTVESGFEIDGTLYEVPEVTSLNVGERMVLHDYAGLVQEDFVRLEDETDEEMEARHETMLRRPGFIPALMHIAYARANPKLSREKVAKVIESTNYLAAISTLVAETPDEEAEDDRPPDLTTRTLDSDEPSSPIALHDSSASSGSRDSSLSSDVPDAPLANTGASR